MVAASGNVYLAGLNKSGTSCGNGADEGSLVSEHRPKVRLLRGEMIITEQQQVARLDASGESAPVERSRSSSTSWTPVVAVDGISLIYAKESPRKGPLARGVLFLTNYRLVYTDYQHAPFNIDVPLCSFARATLGSEGTSIRLFSKIISRNLIFSFDRGPSWVEGLLTHINRLAFPGNQTRLFAFQHTLELTGKDDVNGWELYSPEREYQRCLALVSNEALRITQVNKDFGICESYPSVFVVPSCVSDDDLAAIAQHRSRGRVPAIVWCCPKTGATLSR